MNLGMQIFDKILKNLKLHILKDTDEIGNATSNTNCPVSEGTSEEKT
jgi:hypothetical protein